MAAFTIAELTDMVAAANAGDAVFIRLVDELNQMMRERSFPMDLRARLREFLQVRLRATQFRRGRGGGRWREFPKGVKTTFASVRMVNLTKSSYVFWSIGFHLDSR